MPGVLDHQIVSSCKKLLRGVVEFFALADASALGGPVKPGHDKWGECSASPRENLFLEVTGVGFRHLVVGLNPASKIPAIRPSLMQFPDIAPPSRGQESRV